jgi:hypothetical protein
MGTISKCEIHLCFIYIVWVYMLYLGYKNKRSIEFNYQVSTPVQHCVHVGAQKVSDFGGFRISEFRIRDIPPVYWMRGWDVIAACKVAGSCTTGVPFSVGTLVFLFATLFIPPVRSADFVSYPVSNVGKGGGGGLSNGVKCLGRLADH